VNYATIILIALAILFVSLGLHQYIGIALATTGIILIIIFIEARSVWGLSRVFWFQLDTFNFIALPLFIFMGNLILRSGLGDRLYQGLTPWISRLPGGLLHSNIASCAFFAAISGSSAATAATIGSFAIPVMVKRGYDKKITMGSIVGAGALGLLIPPSITMVIYAGVADVSLGHLFLGGVIPGIMTAILFMVYITLMATINQKSAPREPKPSLKELVFSLSNIWPTLLIMVLVLGGIYAGVITATEAAAFGTAVAVILTLALRQLNWQKYRLATIESIKTTGLIVLIMMGAFILHTALGRLHIARDILTAFTSLGIARELIFFGIIVFYLILGCFFDGASMTLLTVPVLLPLMIQMGYDPIWFGVVLTILIELAQITPPVGMNLFITANIAKAPVQDVILGSIPFFGIHLLALTLVCLFPQIILWLPSVSYAK